MSDPQKAINRLMSAAAAATLARKEEWIENYMMMAGTKWTDPPVSREEAERAWADGQRGPVRRPWRGKE